MRKLDHFYIAAQTRALKAKEGIKHFFEGEKGVSNVVATIIILLIVVLLIGVFWDRLQEWINKIMDTIFGTEFKANKLDKG